MNIRDFISYYIPNIRLKIILNSYSNSSYFNKSLILIILIKEYAFFSFKSNISQQSGLQISIDKQQKIVCFFLKKKPPTIASRNKSSIFASLSEKTSTLGLVVQLVRMPACHAGGRGFESRPDRELKAKQR